MKDPILTSAHPGGLHHTVVKFSSTGADDVVTVQLFYTANTKYFFQTPTSGESLGIESLLRLRGVQYVQVKVTLLGDTGQAFADISRTLIETITADGRTTNLTSTYLYNWLTSLWVSLKTHFIAAMTRNVEAKTAWDACKSLYLTSDAAYAPSPYTLTYSCPDSPPQALAVTYPNILSANTPSSIPPFQVHGPSTFPFSDLPLGDPSRAYLSQAFATIIYPRPGTLVLADGPVLLIADAGLQTSSSHTFVWYISGLPALRGSQIPATFKNDGYTNITVPLTLLVTNNLTGVSSADISYVIVQP